MQGPDHSHQLSIMPSKQPRQPLFLLATIIVLFSNVVSALPTVSIKPAGQLTNGPSGNQNRLIAIVCGTVGGLISLCIIVYTLFRLCKTFYQTKVMRPVVQRSRTMSFAITRPMPPQRSRTMDLFTRASVGLATPTVRETDETLQQPFLSAMSPPLPSMRDEDGPPSYDFATKSPLTPITPNFSPDRERNRLPSPA
jgi:hypothetical protein